MNWFIRKFCAIKLVSLLFLSAFAVGHQSFKHIIFDIGGVLLKGDSKQFAEKLFEGKKRETFASLPKMSGWDLWDKGIGTQEDLIESIASSCHLDRDDIRSFIALYLAADRPLFEESWEIVKKLKQR